MLDFKKFIELNEADSSAATNMEKYIVIAYNGGSPEEIEKQKVDPKEYSGKNKEVAEKIAKDIREKTGASKGSMIHFGKGSGKMIDWWEGNPTPKTDLYSTDKINISLKQKGGSQLMSGFPGETRSTFKAANILMGENSPKNIDKLVESLNAAMKTIIVPGNINSMVDAIKTGKVSSVINAKTTSGKDATIKIVDKIPKKKEDNTIYFTKDEYDKSMKEFIDWKQAMKKITPTVKDFFENNDDFKTWFAYEAATGVTKFKPDPAAKANWVVEFDPNGGKNNVQPLDLNGKPSNYLKELAKKAKIRISPKTATGSKVSKDGFGTSTTSLRLTLDSYQQNKPMIQEHIERRFNEYLINAATLNEDSILQKIGDWTKNIKDWFKKLLLEIVDIITKLAKKGLDYLLEFIGFSVDRVDIDGDLQIFFTE